MNETIMLKTTFLILFLDRESPLQGTNNMLRKDLEGKTLHPFAGRKDRHE